MSNYLLKFSGQKLAINIMLCSPFRFLLNMGLGGHSSFIGLMVKNLSFFLLPKPTMASSIQLLGETNLEAKYSDVQLLVSQLSLRDQAYHHLETNFFHISLTIIPLVRGQSCPQPRNRGRKRFMKLQVWADTQISATGDKHYPCKDTAQTLGGITSLSDVGCKAFCPVLILLFQNQPVSCMLFIVFRKNVDKSIWIGQEKCR